MHGPVFFLLLLLILSNSSKCMCACSVYDKLCREFTMLVSSHYWSGSSWGTNVCTHLIHWLKEVRIRQLLCHIHESVCVQMFVIFKGAKQISFLSIAENKLPENNIRDLRGDFLWTRWRGKRQTDKRENDTERDSCSSGMTTANHTTLASFTV